jgi:hypothetical protein
MPSAVWWNNSAARVNSGDGGADPRADSAHLLGIAQALRGAFDRTEVVRGQCGDDLLNCAEVVAHHLLLMIRHHL